jgi:hypothetical protein
MGLTFEQAVVVLDAANMVNAAPSAAVAEPESYALRGVGSVPYATERERFIFAGDGSEMTPEPGPVRPVRTTRAKRKTTTCASDLYEYSYMRVDPCVTVVGPALPPISSSRDAVTLLHKSVEFQRRDVEFLMIISLDVQNRPRAVAVIHRGGRSAAMVDASVLLQTVLLTGGSAFIMAHNHPSGSAQPSGEDDAVTARVVTAAKAAGLRLLDHLVLTDDEYAYTSYLDTGRLPT